MTDTHTYRTADRSAIAAFRTATAARAEFTLRLRDDAAEIGITGAPQSVHIGFGGPEKIVGFAVDGAVPAGWRIIRDGIEPARRGRGSAAARRWLAEHQPGVDLDPLHVLKSHGLPYQSRTPAPRGGYFSYLPQLFEHAGHLWAGYHGEPDGDFPGEASGLTWPACPVDEFHAAREARRLRHAPLDWIPGLTRVRHADGEEGVYVGNSDPLPGAGRGGWLGVLVRFDGEATNYDVDPADLTVLNPADAPS